MMEQGAVARVRTFREALEREYAERFPLSQAFYARGEPALLDRTSHSIRWNEPFMPLVRSAEGAALEDLDGHRILDYWQGHFANLLGHNPRLIRQELIAALEQGRGLQTGMVHEIEEEVAALIRQCTRSETVRFTTSGSLGTFYAVVLARAYTGRDCVLKVSGGWHGSQPFGLKGVSAHGTSFDHLESEGLSASTTAEIVLTRFNDVDHLRRTFERLGQRIACLLLEPVLGSGGGMAATREYLQEARRLTAKHGSLLLCDEIITAFRFHAGDLSSQYGVRPDLLILGKVLGGGMPLAAVAGRQEVMELCTRKVGRVKFEGGTYSGHELSLVAARTMLRHLLQVGDELYLRLSKLGDRLRSALALEARQAGFHAHLLGSPGEPCPGGSLVLLHLTGDGGPAPTSPEELAQRRHPRIDEGLLKSTLLLYDLSTRSGLGAISTAHTERDLDQTVESYRLAFRRLNDAGLN